MLKKLFLILAICSFFSLQAEEGEAQPVIKTKILFVLYDAGETLALKGVMEKLAQDKEDFRILVMGTSRELIKKEHFPNRLDFAQLNIPEIDKSWPREKELGKDDLQKLIGQVQAEIVVTGVAAEVQGQILEAYKTKAKTFAYWDNFNPRGSSPYFAVAKKVQERASFVLFPSFYVASSTEFEKEKPACKTHRWTAHFRRMEKRSGICE